jgi:hypothetical protein
MIKWRLFVERKEGVENWSESSVYDTVDEIENAARTHLNAWSTLVRLTVSKVRVD